MNSVLLRELDPDETYEIQNLPFVVQEIIFLYLGPRNFLSYLRANPRAFRYYSHHFPTLYNSLRRQIPNLRSIGTSTSTREGLFVISEDPSDTIFHNYRLFNQAVADVPRQAILNDTSLEIDDPRRQAAELGESKFRNFERLKRSGLGDYYASAGARDLTNSQLVSMIRLFDEGFYDCYAFPGARDLTISRIDTMIMLRNREGFLSAFALRAARDLTDSRLENMIRLKRAGVNENVSIMAAEQFTGTQIDTLLILLANNPGIPGASAYWTVRGDLQIS